jgi:hypothetical protein
MGDLSRMDIKPLGILLLVDSLTPAIGGSTDVIEKVMRLGITGVVLWIFLMERKERQERQDKEDKRYTELIDRADKRYSELVDRLFNLMQVTRSQGNGR